MQHDIQGDVTLLNKLSSFILDLFYAALSSIIIVNYMVDIFYNFCAEQFCKTLIKLLDRPL